MNAGWMQQCTRRWCARRFVSTKSGGEQMRIAIVGGGCAGLSSALHLAPLVHQGLIAGPIDVYERGSSAREIGVGIWNTAIQPFSSSNSSESHAFVYHELMQQGSWIGDVGYRTPQGVWLAKSHLPMEDSKQAPALLFLREMDLLKTLQTAVVLEQHKGTIRLLSGTSVTSIQETSTLPFSAALSLKHGTATERDYHFIVAADGTGSELRKRYGGHLRSRRTLGTTLNSSPLDLPSNPTRTTWQQMSQLEATLLQDRNYNVFRGNSNLVSQDQIGFQTWGEGQSMRFAVVPMSYPGKGGTRIQKQTWFITTDDTNIATETDPTRRHQLLLDAFNDWHDPICDIVQATPPETILMEHAVAHKHSMGPVLNINRVISQITGRTPLSAGAGPAMVFVGDAHMTVDPILAQGFSMGMEGAAALVDAVQTSCGQQQDGLAFSPHVLRKGLAQRHEERTGRLICLLRATELVQALGQPMTGTLSGFVSKNIVRNLMRISPNFIKKPMFNAMLQYSLGWNHRKQ